MRGRERGDFGNILWIGAVTGGIFLAAQILALRPWSVVMDAALSQAARRRLRAQANGDLETLVGGHFAGHCGPGHHTAFATRNDAAVGSGWHDGSPVAVESAPDVGPEDFSGGLPAARPKSFFARRSAPPAPMTSSKPVRGRYPPQQCRSILEADPRQNVRVFHPYRLQVLRIQSE